MKNNFEKVMNVGKTVLAGAGLFALACVNGACDALETAENERKDKLNSVAYCDAVSAIMESDMFSSDKRAAIASMSTTADEGIYKAVISVAKSDSFSSEKRRIIAMIFGKAE